MKYDISLNGTKYVVEIDDTKAKILSKEAIPEPEDDILDVPDFDFEEETQDASVVKAALPGTVVAIKVRAGEEVKKGQTLLILESMKMENAITAPCDGRVENVLVREGADVRKDQELVAIKVPELVF